MSLSIFSNDMIFINPEIQSNDQQGVIQFLCGKMAEKGYVTGEYSEQVIAREKIHPTGLPTLPFASAVPHADPVGVNSSGIALAVLEKPVVFQAIDNPKKALDVYLVFLMSFAKGDQIAMLRWISNALGSQDIVRKITESKDSSSTYKIIKPLLDNSLN